MIFLITVFFLLWRPMNINEAIPPAIGASLLYALGIVTLADINYVLGTVTGASITIISTMVMSIVLESMGFFRWVAFNLVAKCKGSGTLLYWNVILLCFLMTLFFNNDGSIVITTPIIIEIVSILELKAQQKFAYLLSGAIIATASSAPIGVSNLANLIALKIVGVDLFTHTKYMFAPSMLGLFVISILFFLYFRKDIPKHIPSFSRACVRLYETCITNCELRPPHKKHAPPPPKPPHSQPPPKQFLAFPSFPAINWTVFKIYMAIIIIGRASLFILSYYGYSIEWSAVLCAFLIVLIRWYTQGTGVIDVLKKTPWHVFVFAFSMYLVVYGLHNVHFTTLIIDLIKEPVSAHLYNAILIMGTLTTGMASLFNNHPSLMLATTIITNMGLDIQYMQVTYLAIILGSDIGSLILPSGTLASLIWLHILKNNNIHISWRQYINVTLRVIPVGLLVSLISLYFWIILLS
ncbi:MAG: arsenic transporter [Pelosinus sp.]|nr:arsenic transporter [Pelosinus sp.]